MKIDSSVVGMESSRSYSRSSITVRRFAITEYQQALTQGEETLNTAEGDEENTENTEKNTQKATLQEWQSRFQMSAASVSIRSTSSQTLTDIRQLTVRYIFDLLFGARRNRMSRWLQGGETGSSQSYLSYQQTSASLSYSNAVLSAQPRSLMSTMRVLNYSQETFDLETEETRFSTVGTVRTSDGREITFNVNVGMSREFQHYFKDELELASFTLCDPLVLNLDTDATELSDQTFYFDIDGDGELDEISQLGAGSGYLALDKNGDGIINDGTELFGTSSGNGFADLAQYDEDGNGWIDENDAIWDKLLIWCKDENGNDVLYKLADKGVGAICLQNVSTDFTLQGQQGQTQGVVRNTGIFLYENGCAGTIQHVDVAKYDRQA